MSADDALVTVQERGLGATPFPARPSTFPRGVNPAINRRLVSCVGRAVPPVSGSCIPFSDAGRDFSALVVVGAGAPPAVRGQAFRILDRLRFDPGVRPDWRSGG